MLYLRRCNMDKLTRSQIEERGFTVIDERYPWQFTNGIYSLTTSIYPKTKDLPEDTFISIRHIADEETCFYGRLQNKQELVNVLTYINR